jgi:hypothetical protein
MASASSSLTARLSRRGTLLLWFGILGGPVMWTIHIVGSSAIVSYACGSWGLISIHLLTAGTGVLTIASGAAAILGGRPPPLQAIATPVTTEPRPQLPTKRPRRGMTELLFEWALSALVGPKREQRPSESELYDPAAWTVEPTREAVEARRRFMSRFGLLLAAISLFLIVLEGVGPFFSRLCRSGP